MGFDFFGGKKRKDIRAGANRARTEIGEHYDSGRGITKQYSEQAQTYLAPQLESGRRATKQYETFLGLNGADEQQAAFDAYETSPGFQAKLDAGNRNIESRMNAKGALYSGRALKELRDYGHNELNADWNSSMDRLERMSGRGNESSRAAADLEFRTGSELASSHYGQGGMMANIALNEAEQIANSRLTLGDLAGLIGGAAKAIAAF